MDAIKVTGGMIEEVQEEGYVSFQGIPYAAVSSKLGRQPVYVYDFCRQGEQHGRKAAYHGLDTHYMFDSQGKLPGAGGDDDRAALDESRKKECDQWESN